MARRDANLPYIPTGYEGVPESIARNRQVADALTQAGLQGPKNATHGAQLLGSLAQALSGGLVNRRAMQDEYALRTQTAGDERTRLNAITLAMKDGVALPDILGAFGGNQPDGVEKIVETLLNVEEERLKLGQKRGDPRHMIGPNGQRQTVQLDGTGNIIPVQGFQEPEKIENVHGVATALQAQQPGAILPQNYNDLVVLGPNGAPQQNNLALGAKTQVAAAGRPTTSINTAFQVDTMDALAKFLPPNQIKGLDDSRAIAEGFVASMPGLARAAAAVNSGVITGAFANVRLQTLKAAELLGIPGKTDQEKIVNTETFVREQGAAIRPILQQLRPASDTDVKTARAMVGGDPTLSLGAIKAAINAAQQDGNWLVNRHNRRVDDLARIYGKQAPDAALSIQSYRVLPHEEVLSDPLSAEEWLKRNRKR
jgi:hypothetical protein